MSVSHSAALPHRQTRDTLLADSMQQCRRAEEMHNMLIQRKSKEHIDARKHKAKVREDRMKNREPVMKELFDLRRASAFKSNYEDFKSYIDYQARLQHLDDHDTLSPSASLTGLRLKEDTPSLSHRHSFSDTFPSWKMQRRSCCGLWQVPRRSPSRPMNGFVKRRKKDEEILFSAFFEVLC
ncbi:hypothetical protein EV363DRAFT_437187 [Boletus edulis]|nr:hypothetical protein EV363DRAFT_437187 [Boletus edulis]